MSSGSGTLDIFNRLRSLLHSFGIPSQDKSLKRRASDQTAHPSLTKYRRVTNVFPQVIHKPFEEDQYFLQPRFVDPNTALNMTERRSPQHSRVDITNSTSLNANPHTYAELEYSDDDDDVVFTNPRRGTPLKSTTPGTACLNNLNRKHLNVIFPDHIPVIVRNTKASSPLANISTKRPSNTTINGNVSDIPPLVKAFNYVRDKSSTSKTDSSRDTWHKRLLQGKSSRDTVVKSIPPLIEAKTGRLTTSTIPPDAGPYFASIRAYINGDDPPKEVAPLTNGVVRNSDNSYRNTSTTTNGQQQQQSPVVLKRVANSSTERAFNVKDFHTYRDLLKRIVPGLYKSNDIRRDRQRLAQLAEVRNSSKKSQQNVLVTINLTDDENDELQQPEIIDLSDDDLQMISACRKVQPSSKAESKKELPVVEPVNSLRDKLDSAPTLHPQWLGKFQNTYKERSQQSKQQILEAEKDVRKYSADTEKQEKVLVERFRNCMVYQEPIILDDEEEEEEEEFPELTDEQKSLVKRAIYRGSSDEVLISKFNMNITRRDINTLCGDTWLNDEVINFYMNLLMERSDERHSDGLPKVYAMNTFFVPRLLQSGHSAVRRWTRKVDIFSYDIIPVPVHVGQVHWCMAIIHLRNRTIKYYDSMGTPNPRLLNALEEYLRDESVDKRKESFDTSKFHKESVSSAPRQMNGSDCGVFSCMFAEYITRNREITFSQQHMPYFRQKMILEIVQGKLLL